MQIPCNTDIYTSKGFCHTKLSIYNSSNNIAYFSPIRTYKIAGFEMTPAFTLFKF